MKYYNHSVALTAIKCLLKKLLCIMYQFFRNVVTKTKNKKKHHTHKETATHKTIALLRIYEKDYIIIIALCFVIG